MVGRSRPSCRRGELEGYFKAGSGKVIPKKRILTDEVPFSGTKSGRALRDNVSRPDFHRDGIFLM